MNKMLTCLTTLIFFSSYIKAQQNYSGNEVLKCNGDDEKNPSESFLYTCNGKYSSCRTFLIFTARFPYNTVPAIATLTSSNQDEISRLNNVTQFTIFKTEQEVIIPVNCSCSGCSGRYYQASTTYHMLTPNETYHTIANSTFQGLSTCDSLKRANTHSEFSLPLGHKLKVPLRCACPTTEQTANRTEYLLTYSISRDDTLYRLGQRFNVSVMEIIKANGFSDEHETIYPFTTIVIPLPNEPKSSYTVTRSFNFTPSHSPPPFAKKSKSNIVLSCIGIAAGILSLLILLILVLIFLFHKKRTRVQQSRGRENKKPSPEDLIVEISRFDRVLKVFKFEEIKKATRNFTSKRRIEGCVYRGTFHKQVLAVKKINRDPHDEVNMLYQINHLNIVKLHGFCQEKEKTYLVYEYMKNGSLQQWLRKRGSKDVKSWNQRIRIALDVANGLLYLHNFTKPAYVHNDVRSSNILLDGNMRAKIANFSRATTANSQATTARVVRLEAYVAPECVSSPGPVSPKVDVFAFGVILLELIIDRHPVSTVIDEIIQSQNTASDLSRFSEPCLVENGGMENAVQVARLGLSCLRQDPAHRPSMVEVVSALQKLQLNLHKSGIV